METPPTADPLYALKGIIYVIENRLNGMRYVGQTMNSFARRYRSCRWWKGTNNPYLKAAAAKHGPDAFTVTVLEHSKTVEELNQLEAHYAETFDCYAPKGYNLVECGNNKRQHPDSVRKRSRTITLNDPEGNDRTITNIRAFCRENGLCNRSFCRMLKGQLASCKGWTLQGVTEKHRRNNHRYTLYDQTGKRYDVVGLTAFCRERGLDYYGMRSMTQGKTFESQGFALSVEAFAQQRQRHVVTLVKDGQEVTLHSVKRDAPALGLCPHPIYMLINGRISSYKGWTLKACTSEPIQWGRAA